MESRPWVLTQTGRNEFLGFDLECKLCDSEPGSEKAGQEIR